MLSPLVSRADAAADNVRDAFDDQLGLGAGEGRVVDPVRMTELVDERRDPSVGR